MYQLNGSYLSGYSAKDKKPFDELDIVRDAETEISAYLNQTSHAANRLIVERTKNFLSGFYSPFSLELLSSVDYLMETHKLSTAEEVGTYLEAWSDRKKTLFSNSRFISIAVQKISQLST